MSPLSGRQISAQDAQALLEPILLTDCSAYDPSFRRPSDPRAILTDVSTPLQRDVIETLRAISGDTDALLSMIDRSLDGSFHDDWILSLNDYTTYISIAASTHVLAALDASWAVLTSWDGHALVGGDSTVVQALLDLNGATAEGAAASLLDEWKEMADASGGTLDVAWIQPLIKHMLPPPAVVDVMEHHGSWLRRDKTS